MKTARITGIILIALIAGTAIVLKMTVLRDNADLSIIGETQLASILSQDIVAFEQAKIHEKTERLKTDTLEQQFKQAKIQNARALIPWKTKAYQIAVFAVFAVPSLSLLIFSTYAGIGRLRKSSIVTQRIGEHSEMNVHYSLVKRPEFGFLLAGLVESEKLKALYPEKALEFSDKMLTHIEKISRGHLTPGASFQALPEAQTIINDHVPTFSELLQTGQLAEGKPLILGFANGEPQTRTLEDIKAISIAGWQGSGKTLSTAYLAACLLLQHKNSQGYIIDPHRGHDEGLGNILKPLESTGRLKVVSSFETPELFEQLNNTLDARLSGKEASEPLIFLAIDELAKIGRSEIFQEKILPFVERCTEETRKANILFLGISQKWQARFFGGKADIRQSIPSLLIHKMKPEMAELLLEDSQEKKLVKQLKRPGECLLATSHDADPKIVRMPLITRQDILTVVAKVANGQPVTVTQEVVTPLYNVESQDLPLVTSQEPVTPSVSGGLHPFQGDHLWEGLHVFLQDKSNSLPKLEEMSGVNRGLLSMFHNGKRGLTDDNRGKLSAVLQAVTPLVTGCNRSNVVQFERKRAE